MLCTLPIIILFLLRIKNMNASASFIYCLKPWNALSLYTLVYIYVYFIFIVSQEGRGNIYRFAIVNWKVK